MGKKEITISLKKDEGESRIILDEDILNDDDTVLETFRRLKENLERRMKEQTLKEKNK